VKLIYLLDTNIISEPLRPEPDAGVTMHLARYDGQFAIPAIVWHELWFGCLRLSASMKRIAIERFLTEVVQRSVPILPYDARAAQWHAAERARLTRLGKTPSFSDGQIAAIAVVNQLTLVTNNVSDFALFDELHVVHWRQNAL
jgi:tRNA(fMet)-specific endonuclease VapC